MPQVVRTQVILNPAAVPREQIMNTWHCVTVGSTTPLAAVTDFHTALDTFYNAIEAHFSSELTASTPLARAFDLGEPKPRQPILESTFGALAAASNMSPREIACCLSYKGTYLSGVSPKRKRGRIYLGPLGQAQISATSGLFTTTFRNAVASAADALVTTSDGSATFRWVVYSPTTDSLGTGQDLDSWDAVTEGWIDEAPDIQRRRGVPGGARTLWT